MPKLFIVLMQSLLAYSQTFLAPRHVSSETSCPTILGANPSSYWNRDQWDECPGCFSLSTWIILGPFALCAFSPPDVQFKQPELSPGCRSGQVRQGMKGWWDPASHRAVAYGPVALCPHLSRLCINGQPRKTSIAPHSPRAGHQLRKAATAQKQFLGTGLRAPGSLAPGWAHAHPHPDPEWDLQPS